MSPLFPSLLLIAALKNCLVSCMWLSQAHRM
jgi:hypothetical protein